MAFSFQSIRYGWVALASVVLTGATIYVATNARERVQQIDVIEIVLATHERCLATEYGTNEDGTAKYHVAPPSVVRDWTDSNGTVRVTNAIGWRLDRGMLTNLDATIKALVPYYADTNTLAAYTVTGLWAALAIGDGTNQFTQTPEWVATNGVTNAATYGGIPWRLHKTALEERYKVLHALAARAHAVDCVGTNYRGYSYPLGEFDATWGAAKTNAETYVKTGSNFIGRLLKSPARYSIGIGRVGVTEYAAEQYYGAWRFAVSNISTSVSHRATFFVQSSTAYRFNPDFVFMTVSNAANKTFDGYGEIVDTNGWQVFDTTEWVTNSGFYSKQIGSTNYPTWCDQPSSNVYEYYWSSGDYYPIYARARGYLTTGWTGIVSFAFAYATNKYW